MYTKLVRTGTILKSYEQLNTMQNTCHHTHWYNASHNKLFDIFHAITAHVCLLHTCQLSITYVQTQFVEFIDDVLLCMSDPRAFT